MALVNQVQKHVRMAKWDIIKADLECLTLLSLNSPIELTHFCYDASEEHGVFKSAQTVRNSINKAEKVGLVLKNTNNKKQISINPNLKIQTEGTILLDFKFLANDTQEA
jgi:hypothetical protein